MVGPVWIKKGGKVLTECCLLTREQLPVADNGVLVLHITWAGFGVCYARKSLLLTADSESSCSLFGGDLPKEQHVICYQ